jgi:hypothetical protein
MIRLISGFCLENFLASNDDLKNRHVFVKTEIFGGEIRRSLGEMYWEGRR